MLDDKRLPMNDISSSTSPEHITPFSPDNEPRLNRSREITEADTFNRKKKKRKGFFRTLGFEKLYIPYSIFSIIASVTFAIVSLTLTIVFPTLQYCLFGDCTPFDTFTVDTVFTSVGCAVGAFLLLLEVALILCPGALMEHPKVVKRCALFCIFLTFWATVLSIAPSSSKRSYAIPYNRVQKFNFSSTPIPVNGTAKFRFQDVFRAGLYEDNSRVLMRVYTMYLPYYTKITDYPLSSNYYVYSDPSYDQSK